MGDNTHGKTVKFAEPAALPPALAGQPGEQYPPIEIEFIRADERMRIAQHLHNSSCQLLAVLQLKLGRMRRQGIDEIEANVAECEELIAQIGCQIRGIGKADAA